MHAAIALTLHEFGIDPARVDQATDEAIIACNRELSDFIIDGSPTPDERDSAVEAMRLLASVLESRDAEEA